MTDAKTKVTLVGTVLAKPGTEFIYEGEAPGCGTCKVKKACNNLQKGRKYRVVTVRTTHHDCTVHLNGATAVEVMEAPITLLISPEMAIINSKIKPEFSCNKQDCRSFDLCRPEGVVEGEKYIVVDVLGNAPDICEKGRALKLVEIKPA
ncbi:UPF0179 family protein [Methanoregula formicica]|uniref:UPF0179 protein Metfor_0993 n=1 Tax=Methanoregula formicica (strain DSM 22288 / NBRC 105244 / SMSP) TaxID=593750 RepID=L0HDE9_METFS|nr:UPF0179 family protein [Methanoregula formicica]AGB02045.1 hypothetical protein Metfor_0993 [Methanoregula formicica SMSP]